MHTEFDGIAEQYQRSKALPWRHHIEQFSLFRLLGDVSGKSVLDLACGEGHYTRLVKHLGAKRVRGVDISGRMIELAQSLEEAVPLGIEYKVGDARFLRLDERFDVVIAAYLLNYADTPHDLLQMCQSISEHLNPGGTFCTVNNNPSQSVSHFGSTAKYGFIKSMKGEPYNGAPIQYTFYNGTETFELENYHLDPAVHERALAAAGLAGAQWHAMQLSPHAAANGNSSFWNDFFHDPPVIMLTAQKPAAAEPIKRHAANV